ncbi:MAG: hypothetical protein WDN69_35435 [Aliidongia sp.]
MTVEWSEEFKHKHIVIVNDAKSFVEMVAQGIKIYKARLAGTDGQKQVSGKIERGLRAAGNTAVITTAGGFQQMEAWVDQNGEHGAKRNKNEVPIRSGAIIQAKDKTSMATLSAGGGTIKVQIEVSGNTKKVIHLSECKFNGSLATGQNVYTGDQVMERQALILRKVNNNKEILRVIDGLSTGQPSNP